MATEPVGAGAMASVANRSGNDGIGVSRNGSDGIGASRNGKGDGDGGQSKREGRWRGMGTMASVPVGTGRAMAIAAASRNGKGDGDGGQSKREGLRQRRPIETGTMATAASLHSKQKISSGDGGVGRGWGDGSVDRGWGDGSVGRAGATVASVEVGATVASVERKWRRCGVDQSSIATVASIKAV
jgi:hypothetical protein